MITLSGVTVGTCTGSQESPPFFETCMTRVLLFWKKKGQKKLKSVCLACGPLKKMNQIVHSNYLWRSRKQG